MNRKKILVWTGVFIVGLFLVVAIFQARKLATSRSNVEALGLRGTSKVAKPLSTTQAERLETHFLDIPAPARSQSTGPSVGGPSVEGPSSVMETLNQVESINKLNERQTR